MTVLMVLILNCFIRRLPSISFSSSSSHLHLSASFCFFALLPGARPSSRPCWSGPRRCRRSPSNNSCQPPVSSLGFQIFLVSPSLASSWLPARRFPWCSPQKPPSQFGAHIGKFDKILSRFRNCNLEKNIVDTHESPQVFWCYSRKFKWNSPNCSKHHLLMTPLLVILPIYQFKFHLNSSTKKSPNLIREPDTALARILPCKHTCTSRHGRLTLEKNLLLPTFFLHQAVGGTMFPHRLPLDDWLEGAQRMMAKHHHLSVDSNLRCAPHSYHIYHFTQKF